MAQLVSQVILPIALALIMLVMGMGLTAKDFKNLVIFPKAVVLGLALQLLFLPVLAITIALVFQLDPVASAGLFLLSLCPGGATSNMFSSLAKGNVALSVSLTAITSLLVPFLLPISFAFYLSFSGSSLVELNMPIALIMKQLIMVTLAPVLIGMLLRHLLTEKIKKVTPILKKLAAILMVVVIILLMATNWRTLIASLSIVGVASIGLCTMALSLAYVISQKLGLNGQSVRTIAIEVGVQNAGTAMLVALTVLNQPELALIPLMYGLLMNIPAFSFVWWVNTSQHKEVII